MRNGAFQAFQILGNDMGVGNVLVSYLCPDRYDWTDCCLAFSIDAPLQILLNNADEEFVPSWLRKRTARKASSPMVTS